MTKKIAKSPDRNSFQKIKYLDRCAQNNTEPNPDYLAMFDNIKVQVQDWEQQAHTYDLEYDLRTCEWMVDKTRSSKTYAQNLYAAMCNNDFQKLDTWTILADKTWGCSWRHAGGIVADMRGQGDYIDWYCSGMGDGLGNGDSDGSKRYVGEGFVTDEIEEDLKQLGWKVLPDEDL